MNLDINCPCILTNNLESIILDICIFLKNCLKIVYITKEAYFFSIFINILTCTNYVSYIISFCLPWKITIEVQSTYTLNMINKYFGNLSNIKINKDKDRNLNINQLRGINLHTTILLDATRVTSIDNLYQKYLDFPILQNRTYTGISKNEIPIKKRISTIIDNSKVHSFDTNVYVEISGTFFSIFSQDLSNRYILGCYLDILSSGSILNVSNLITSSIRLHSSIIYLQTVNYIRKYNEFQANQMDILSTIVTIDPNSNCNKFPEDLFFSRDTPKQQKDQNSSSIQILIYVDYCYNPRIFVDIIPPNIHDKSFGVCNSLIKLFPYIQNISWLRFLIQGKFKSEIYSKL